MTLTKDDLHAIQQLVNAEVDQLKTDVGGLTKDMRSVKRTVNRTAKDVKYISGKFDQEIVYTQRRVTRIEEHLGLDRN